jgi:hypothetical protein
MHEDEKKQIRFNFENLVRDYLHLRIEIKMKLELYGNLEKRLKTYRAMGYIDESIFDSNYDFISEKKN